MKTFNAKEFVTIGSRMGLFDKDWAIKMCAQEKKRSGKTEWYESELYDYHRLFEITEEYYNRRFSNYVTIRDKELYGYNYESNYN